MQSINFGINDLPSFAEMQRAAQLGTGVSKVIVGVTIILGFQVVGYGVIFNGINTLYKSISESSELESSEEHCSDDGSISSMICSGVSDYCEAYPDSIFC